MSFARTARCSSAWHRMLIWTASCGQQTAPSEIGRSGARATKQVCVEREEGNCKSRAPSAHLQLFLLQNQLVLESASLYKVSHALLQQL